MRGPGRRAASGEMGTGEVDAPDGGTADDAAGAAAGAGVGGASDSGTPFAASAKSQSTKLASMKTKISDGERVAWADGVPKSGPITVPRRLKG